MAENNQVMDEQSRLGVVGEGGREPCPNHQSYHLPRMAECRPRVYSPKCSLRGFTQQDELKFTRKVELAARQIHVHIAITSLEGKQD